MIRPALALSTLFFLCAACSPQPAGKKGGDAPLLFKNHSDTARYVGMETCRSCHQDIYNTFIRTGMGRSFGIATRERSAADFTSARVKDPYTGFGYHAAWRGDSLFMTEFRLAKGDTAHRRTEQVNYIVGSGQHTNSHICAVNGYITQMPMTYYTQSRRWDLPPGFENGVNTRFDRKIGLECMTCHNGFPDFVKGSENKFNSLPGGIDCERCHGPGSIHVAERRTLPPVDTAHAIDRSIVNPAKLPVDLQFDVCQRCHLQGNAILAEGKSFYDFRPGMRLSDFIQVFMPRHENGEDEFIMASHAERLKMSPCFIKSLKPSEPGVLRPYKQALTCVTCHNPHVSVKETNPDVFNAVCRDCHGDAQAMQKTHSGIRKWDDCVKCHMPVSGSTDIPHVTIHDHYIRRPVSPAEKKKIGRFLGLYAVNNKNPDVLTRARAYLDQYEKFSQDKQFLDSAEALLNLAGNPEKNIRYRIQLHFARGDYEGVARAVRSVGLDKCLSTIFTHTTFDNADAWAAYRAGESFAALHENESALKCMHKAVELAPYNPDFRNKLGVQLMGAGKIDAAEEAFVFIMRENPKYASAYANLGYVRLLKGQFAEARRLLVEGRKLDPDNETLLLNLATASLRLGDRGQATEALRRVLSLNPRHQKARQALGQLTHGKETKEK